jgi:hypothetical protein
MEYSKSCLHLVPIVAALRGRIYQQFVRGVHESQLLTQTWMGVPLQSPEFGSPRQAKLQIRRTISA